MADELNFDPDEILSAITAGLEGYSADMAPTQVGRVVEVGDGIARVSGLPNAAVNELLEFEDGTLGLAPQPRRRFDWRCGPR